MLSGLLARLNPNPKVPRAFDLSDRTTVCPPAPTRDRVSRRRALRNWLISGWRDAGLGLQLLDRQEPPRHATPLGVVRLEFSAALRGIRTQQAGDLESRICCAASLRDLWHLRADVFNLVSQHRDQTEAAARLSALNRHFPSRTPVIGTPAFSVSLRGKEKRA